MRRAALTRWLSCTNWCVALLLLLLLLLLYSQTSALLALPLFATFIQIACFIVFGCVLD
jgi:anaerobic C4-dicarboxylate transporter